MKSCYCCVTFGQIIDEAKVRIDSSDSDYNSVDDPSDDKKGVKSYSEKPVCTFGLYLHLYAMNETDKMRICFLLNSNE